MGRGSWGEGELEVGGRCGQREMLAADFSKAPREAGREGEGAEIRRGAEGRGVLGESMRRGLGRGLGSFQSH